MTYDAFEVVIVPFPFTDRRATKLRPALVLSDAHTFNSPTGHLVLATITSADNAPWPLDTPIEDLAGAGRPSPSVARMKLFTLAATLLLRRAGTLGAGDRRAVKAAVGRMLG